MNPSDIDLSLCICTFKRPAGLRKLLASLAALTPPDDCSFEVLVVDNDGTGSARSVVEEARTCFPWPLRYALEARSGVGHARNRCVKEAAGSWIAFIDDDEWAEGEWLSALVTAAKTHAADAVFGPVLPEFEHEVPSEMLASGYFKRSRLETGRQLDWRQCATGNVLFKRQLFEQVGGFRAGFAVSGGEDSEFFSRCQHQGAVLIWCDTAVVHEDIPADRITRDWLLRRYYLTANNYARVRRTHGGWPAAADMALRGLAGLIVFGVAALAARLTGSSVRLAYECKAASGLGKLAAIAVSPRNSFGGQAD